MRTTDDLIRIAAAGGGFIIESTGRSVNDLIRIAAAGSTHSARIVIRNAGRLSTEDMIRIGAAGKGSVQFEMS
jgi:hypothetical protein